MADLPDRLKDYITVAERIEAFYAKFPDGSLQSRIVELSESLVVMEASAYRVADDPRPGIGYSSMPIPAKNAMLRDSEIETCETSAWGRAIAALGFEVKKAVASRNEIEAKEGEESKLTPSGDGSLVGIARIGTKNSSDGELRATPTGHRLGFRLSPREGDRGGILVEANDLLAEALTAVRSDWVDKPVTCWGRVEDRTFRPKGAQRDVKFQALVLSKMRTAEWVLPSETVQADPSGPGNREVAGAVDVSQAAPAATDPDLEAFQEANPSLALVPDYPVDHEEGE